MREPARHILFVATEYAAGMRPYASTIVHTMWQAGDHVLVVAKDDSVKHDFDDLPGDSVTWVDYPKAKSQKLAFRFRPKRLISMIEQLVTERNLQLIYCLTGELVLAHSIRRLQRLSPLLYTIHDAEGHDSKFEGLATWLKHKVLIAWPQQLIIKKTQFQITNSRAQQRQVQERFPYHKVHFAPFPTLVTDGIMRGEDTVPETADVEDGYLLFFGNLQLYKGVHVLYEAYMSHPELQQRPLVIAGSGYIYFKRRHDEQGVTFVNRYIDDAQLRDLFTRAAVVVYPYISATQSGVASIASYFGKPMVVSDLPFFKETCEGCAGVEFFPSGDIEGLADAIKRSLDAPTSTLDMYQRQYSPEALRDALIEVIARSC